MSDRRSKKEQRETSRSEDDVVITEHRVGKRKDADDVCPIEPEDTECVRKDVKKLNLSIAQLKMHTWKSLKFIALYSKIKNLKLNFY